MGITRAIRAQKREAAEKRQLVYDKLSLEEKIVRAGAKEKLKLMKKVQK